ncbi:MAG: hypothetical protein IT542_00515 [Rubellimicrobium sp.]|nr:hypothetical protein [Rubellimicrobium sp.]
MSRIRKLAVAGGTFSVALGIGFVMQNGDVLAARFGPAGPAAPGLQTASGATTQVAAAAMATPSPRLGGGLEDHPMPAVLQAPPADLRAGPDSTAARTLPDEAAVPDMPAAIDLPAGTHLASADLSAIVPEAVSDTVPPHGISSPTLTVTSEPIPEAIAPTPAPSIEEVAAAPAGADECRTTMTATVLPAALVNLDLDAPCAPLARVTFHHQGMMFSALTDAAGKVGVTVPALADPAVFLADVTGGSGAAAVVPAPDIATLDRAVLQWQGNSGLMLHVREFGADYGSPGHVWAQAPRTPAALLENEGGFLMELGDPAAPEPLFAQVYTLAPGDAGHSGDVALTVEAEVTALNCGRDVAAQTIQIAPGEAPVTLDLALPMPDCAAEGEFLVLSGMLNDIHLAAN